MNFLIKLLVIFFIFFEYSFSNENITGQGLVLRVLNKITTEKIFFIMPLSQKLELDNAEILAKSCITVENDGIPDEIALIQHKRKNKKESEDFLGWIFKSSKYINSPINPIYDIQLEECLVDDPIFLQEKRSY